MQMQDVWNANYECVVEGLLSLIQEEESDQIHEFAYELLQMLIKRQPQERLY